MHIIVCLKQVPDTTDVKIDRKTNTLIRDGVASIANPFDLNAVEAALEIKETCGARVTVISMGPPQSKEALRRAVAMGADRAILLSDRSFAGADTLATSYTLSQTIAKLKESDGLDLVICGKQAIDGDTAQVGPGIATRLGLTQLTYVVRVLSVDLKERSLIVERKLEDGIETVLGRLPALLTVVREINRVRYPALPELIQSLTYEPAVWDRTSFSADASKLGLEGSPTAVESIFTPPLRGGGSMLYHGREGFDKEFGAVVERLRAVVEENMKEGCQ